MRLRSGIRWGPGISWGINIYIYIYIYEYIHICCLLAISYRAARQGPQEVSVQYGAVCTDRGVCTGVKYVQYVQIVR